MPSISRVYLYGPAGHRQFYWVEIADDRSVYVGSSNGNLFTYGFGGVSTTSPEMPPIVPERDGHALSQQEIANKISVHGSGVVSLPTESNGLRDRVHIAPPRDGFEALPLVAILPMEPARYPLSQKTRRTTDLCLPESIQDRIPIGVLIYVCAIDAAVPMPISEAKQRLSLVEESSCELAGLSLRAIVYSDPARLTVWQRKEVQLVAHPSKPGSAPNWAFFA